MKYVVYYTQRDNRTAIKADLYAEEGPNRTKIEFDAANDMDARLYLAKTIAPEDPRALKNVTILSKCRVKSKVILNLNLVGDLRDRLEQLISPLIESGDLVNIGGRICTVHRESNEHYERLSGNVLQDY